MPIVLGSPMKYKPSFLLAATIALFSQSAFATDHLSISEESDSTRKLKTEISLLENGPIVDSRLRQKLLTQERVFYNRELDQLTLQGAGHYTTKGCLDFQMAESETEIKWAQEYLEQDKKPNVSILGLITNDKTYVSQLKLSPITSTTEEEALSRHFMIEGIATDTKFRRRGYARALLVLTARFLQQAVKDSDEAATLSITFDANREDLFKTVQSSGFTMFDLTSKGSSEESEETCTPFPESVTTFDKLQAYLSKDALTSQFSVQAKIDLKTINVRPLMSRIATQSNLSS